MFTSIEEGLKAYRATLEHFAWLKGVVPPPRSERDIYTVKYPRGAGLYIMSPRSRCDYDIDREMPLVIVGNKLRGMEEALGLTDDEVKAARAECGLD